MLGYRHIWRTHSTLARLRKLHEFEVEFNIQNTATLVSTYNDVRASHQHHDALVHWIGTYIRFFEKETSSESHHDAMEFAQLANLTLNGPSEMRLLEDAFNVLCTKISEGQYGEEKLFEALNYFLLSVDCQVFVGNPQPLMKIARDVMKKLGRKETFSRGTYPRHSISLLTLHHICSMIHDVDPIEIDHNTQEGLYLDINQCLQNIIDSQSYYPFYYQAAIFQQSLASMDSQPGVSSKERWYRVCCGVKGTVYFLQALVEAISLNIDLSSLENGIKQWIEACTNHFIKQVSWYENVQHLINSRMLVQDNPEKIDIFQECVSMVVEIQDKTKVKRDQKALRFAIIHEVTLLALECQDESVREWAILQLSYLGKCCAPERGWAHDSDILEALVDSIQELYQRLELHSEMKAVSETIRFHIGEEKWTKLIKHWEHKAHWKKDNENASLLDDGARDNNLFNKIKKKLSLDSSVSMRGNTQDILKKYYQEHSKVPSLFENELPKHINTLDHSLVLCEKVFASNGQAHVVKRPILLEDLFRNRHLSRRTLSDRVKRVLLFGNPGTGENSDVTYEALRSQVEKELEKESTLVIFDGLDEGEDMAKEMIISTEKMACRVMVLSRPQNLHSEKNLASVEVECMGLNDEQLVKFIELECSSIELVEHLQRHPSVWEISHTPIVANILTFLYKTRKEYVISDESGVNTSSLYWNMSDQIWTRYVKKVGREFQHDAIFEALEEIAFHALEGGHVLIDQQMVSKYSHDPQTKDTLEDSGFLLLKRECVYYQFPHLSFQEFFAGEYMAHSLLSKDEQRKRTAIEFLNENKYCSNFRKAFCFMIQSLTLENREKGYLEVESIINSEPIALGYQQHLLLIMDLLEAGLSASRPEDREKMLESTEVLDRALDWIQDRECCKDALKRTFFTSEHVSFIFEDFGMPNDNLTEEFNKTFAQVAKVARYIPEQWKKAKDILEKDLSDKNGTKTTLCLVPLIQAVPEDTDSLLELYWSVIDNSDTRTVAAALLQLSDIARMMPNTVEQLFERYKSIVLDNDCKCKEYGYFVDYSRLAEIMPDMWQEILGVIKTTCIDDKEVDDKIVLNQVGRFVEFVPESRSKVMDLIRELSFSDKQSKERMACSCLRFINAMPENATEIAEILWTLCEDKDVYNVARIQAAKIMLSWGEKTDSAVEALLKLSEREPHNSHSLLVRLVGIAYKLIEETPEGVDRLLSSLSLDDLETLWYEVALCIRDSIGTKTEMEMGLHWLHVMIVKALQPTAVKRHELHEMMDIIESDPSKVAMISAKLMSIPQSPCSHRAPMALCKLGLNCPEYEEHIFDTIDGLTQDEDEDVASEACVHMFSILERLPHKAERVMNRLQEFLQRFECLHFVRMRGSVSLESLFEAYMECPYDFLIFWIVWKVFDTPVTMETRENGKTELVVQIASNSKKRYKFQTDEEAEAFASSFDEWIEVVFPDMRSLVQGFDSQKRQGSKNPFFTILREILATSVW